MECMQWNELQVTKKQPKQMAYSVKYGNEWESTDV